MASTNNIANKSIRKVKRIKLNRGEVFSFS